MDSSRETMIAGEEMMPLIKERLSSGQIVRYLPFRGYSMLPMLRQGIDSVELAPLPEKMKKYDLPVYQYPSGKYVMHRIVDVKPDHYVCLGDNTYHYEKITHEQMVAVVSAFKRGEKRIGVDDPLYRTYSRTWVAIYPLRKLLKQIKGKLGRYLRRLLK